MRPSQLVGLELKRLSRNRFAILAASVLVLLPLLYSSLYLYAFWDPYEHLERLKVAIVNQDIPVTREDQTIESGKDLVDKLKDDHSVGWEFTSQEAALDGLNSSHYDLAIIIPKDFSQSILDTTKDSKEEPEGKKAKLLYYSNPGKNYLAEQIGNKVASKLEGDLNGQIAGNFLENVFGSLEDMKSNLEVASEGSSKLYDGIEKAYTGSNEITGHLEDAAQGSNTLRQGLEDLLKGSQDLAQGNTELAEGSVQLQEGSETLHEGVGSALEGSTKLTDGSNELVKGLKDANQSLNDAAIGSSKLYSGLKSANSGSKDLKEGLYHAFAGSLQVKGGATQINGGLLQMQSQLNHPTLGVPALIYGTNQIVQSTSEQGELLQGVLGLHQGLSAQIAPGVQNARNGLNQITPILQATDGNLSSAMSKLEALDTANSNPQIQEAIEELKRAQANIDSNSGSIHQVLSSVDTGLATVAGGISQVDGKLYNAQDNLLKPESIWGGIRALNIGANTIHQGLQQLLDSSNTSLNQLVPGSTQLKEGATGLSTGLASASGGATTLADGLSGLTEGGAELSSGLADGASRFPQLVEGGKALQDGTRQLKEGLSRLNDGMVTFVGKMGDWVTGVGKVSEGSNSLKEGTGQAAEGSRTLSDGLSALHEGSASLTDGLGQAESGSHELFNGLEEGVSKLQKNLPENRLAVSQAMGKSVEVDETQIHPVKNYGTGFTPYFVPLSLWVGALMLFFLLNLKDNSLRAYGISNTRILLGKYATLALLGTAQAVISSFILISVLGLQPQNIWAFYGFNILQSLSYIAIIFLLVKFFDLAGRFVAIVLLMLQLTSGGGTYPVFLIPKFFQVLHPYLPMTYGISALRQIISGSSDISLSTSVIVLLAYGIGALALTLLLSPKNLRIKDLHPKSQLGS